jgi:putative sterol carrier protein
MSFDPSSVRAEDFIAAVRGAEDEHLSQLMASEYRELVLEGIFARFAEHLRPEGAQELQKVIHFKVLDRPDGRYDHYELRIASGSCAVETPPRGDPDVTLKLKPVDFLRLVTGDADGTMLFVRRRLKVDGDLMLAARLQSLFRIPR